MISPLERFRDRLKQPAGKQPYVVAVVMWWLPVMSAIVGAIWTMQTHFRSERQASERTQIEAKRLNETRLLEARQPFLKRKLDLFFEAANIGGLLAAYADSSGGEEWKKAELRFWGMRWSELEMVGNPAIRDRMRALQYAILALKNDFKDKQRQKYVRWMAECVANELRRSLEIDWTSGPIMSNQGGGQLRIQDAPASVTIADVRRELPTGCDFPAAVN